MAVEKEPVWTRGSFLDNLNEAAMRVGYANLPLAWGIAQVPWKSVEDRDNFLRLLTGVEVNQQ